MTRRTFGALPLAAAAISQPGTGIQRTMSALERGERVRILIYGQSITQQNWWKTVADDLKRRFPKSDCRVVNLAIGGYSTQFLRRTIVHDVYPFYPDLTIFHDYGRDDQFEEMIAGIRSRTVSEVLILTDHVCWHPKFDAPDATKADRTSREDKRSFETLPVIAAKYGCGICDIRGAWYKELEARGAAAASFLRDAVHLNDAGCDVYARVVNAALVRNTNAAADKTVVEIPVKWRRGRAEIEFDGNRVDAVASVKGTGARVLIDGRPPSSYSELYSITRPSNTWCVDWPSINRVSSDSPLLVEDWVLRCFETAEDGSKCRFHVIGTETGFDGEGVTTERFVSRSGRVVIEPEDWVFQRAYSLRKIKMPSPFEVQWRVRPMFQDYWHGASPLLAQGLTNGPHRLTLIGDGSGTPPVAAVRVYRPPVKL